MKTTILSLILITLFTAVNAQNESLPIKSSTAPKVIFADDYLFATLDKVMQAAGIEVINTQPTYLEINLGKDLKIKTYIDIDANKEYLLFNGSNALVDGANASQAYQLVSDMNLNTKFIRAAFNKEKNKIDFDYYFWIKDGFTEKSLISALEMYRLSYIYTFTLDTNNLLK